jgi:hypothetical protein
VGEATVAEARPREVRPTLSRIVEEYLALNARYVAILYTMEEKPIIRSRSNPYFRRIVGYRDKIKVLDWQATPDEYLAHTWLQRRREALKKELGVAVEALLLTVEVVG